MQDIITEGSYVAFTFDVIGEVLEKIYKNNKESSTTKANTSISLIAVLTAPRRCVEDIH